MKLLTHNFLACHIKGVTNNYPLKIEATKVGHPAVLSQIMRQLFMLVSADRYESSSE